MFDTLKFIVLFLDSTDFIKYSLHMNMHMKVGLKMLKGSHS